MPPVSLLLVLFKPFLQGNGLLALLAGRVLIPDTPKLFAGGVLGLSATSAVARFISPQTSLGLAGTSLLPTGLYAMVMAASLWRQSRREVE